MLNNKDLPSKDEFIDAVEGAIKVFNELDIKKLKEEIDKLTDDDAKVELTAAAI